jgi:hypothetical protein
MTSMTATTKPKDGLIVLPVRRYAIFHGFPPGTHCAIVVRGDDIERAPKWGGFICWLGGIKEPTTRHTNKHHQRSQP